MFDQVDIDLDKYSDDLSSLIASLQVQEAPKLGKAWRPISEFWSTQPPKNMLSVFVRVLLSAAGEKKIVVVNGTLFITMILSFFQVHNPIAYYNIVPISDDTTIRSRIRVEVPISAQIDEFSNAICAGLVKDGLAGRYYDGDSLKILPLPETPNLNQLQTMDLTTLRKQAQAPNDLSNETATGFFRQQSSGLGLAHFLVWLPPKDGAFYWFNLSNN
jgi:hypothetical protein